MSALDAARARAFELREPAPEADIEALAAFSPAPADLIELLRESNGVYDEFGSAVVWSASEVIARNQEMRTTSDFASLYWSFDQMLFIGEEGGGDLFGFRVLQDQKLPEIYLWEHEDDSRAWFASSLADYFSRRSG